MKIFRLKYASTFFNYPLFENYSRKQRRELKDARPRCTKRRCFPMHSSGRRYSRCVNNGRIVRYTNEIRFSKFEYGTDNYDRSGFFVCNTRASAANTCRLRRNCAPDVFSSMLPRTESVRRTRTSDNRTRHSSLHALHAIRGAPTLGPSRTKIAKSL